LELDDDCSAFDGVEAFGIIGCGFVKRNFFFMACTCDKGKGDFFEGDSFFGVFALGEDEFFPGGGGGGGSESVTISDGIDLFLNCWLDFFSNMSIPVEY
jgi:hypothetical protein